ncbi:MAG: hypothetical protein AMXMBFR7_07560 [Planctomycetota bacterium]
MPQGLDAPRALKDQMAALLEREIDAARYPSGVLPSVRVLAERFEVSVLTVVGALELLERRKRVERVHGKGVFIRDRQGRSRKLGVRNFRIGVFGYSPSGAAGYYGELWGGLSAAAGPRVSLTYMNLAAGREVASIRAAQARLALDGAILVGIPDRSVVDSIRRKRFPVVLADHHFQGAEFDCVTLDSAAGSREAVRHLAALGHRRIGLLTSTRPEYNAERMAGFVDGLREAGLPCETAWVQASHQDFRSGADAFRAILRIARPAPTAWLTWSETQALGALEVLREAGLRVPPDMSIMACSGATLLDFCPSLSAVIGDGRVLGAEALRLLLRRMEEPDAAPQCVRVPMRIHAGETTAAPSKR